MTVTGRTRRRRPPIAAALATALLAGALAGAPAWAPAWAMVGEGADEGVQPVLSQNYTVVAPEALSAAVKADRAYVTGMRAHHAGALTMSESYLADPEARSPALRTLARAIIHNQRFEIALLDEVARNLDQPPRMLDLGLARLAVQPAATEGLALSNRFTAFPIPGPLTPAAPPGLSVTTRDVQFAKAMTIHHQGALDMARAYQSDPNGRNTFLGLLNVDIVTDQSQEIAFMRRVVAAYPGDAAAVPVPASMIHGMEGMSHGGHAGSAPPALDAGGADHTGHLHDAGQGASPTPPPPAGHGARPPARANPARPARGQPGSHGHHGH